MGNITALPVLLLAAGAGLIMMLGLFVVVQSRPITLVRRWFGAVCASAAAWMITNALFEVTHDDIKYTVVLMSYAAAAALATSIAVFCLYIINLPKPKLIIPIKLAGLLAVLLGVTPGLTASGVDGRTIATEALPATVYGALVASLIVFGVVALALGLRKAKGRQARSLRYILAGLAGAAAVGLFTNLLLPIWYLNYDYVAIGPLGVVLFVGASSYAVIRHGLFDVRIAAVRTLAYILSLLTMAGVYFGLAYVVSSTVFRGASTTGVSMSPVNILIALVLAFIFQPIKKFFDRVTDGIFYRDRYDTDTFIAELGDILTSTTTLRTLLSRSARHIEANLKTGHVMFVVLREEKTDTVVGEGQYPQLKAEDRALISDFVRGHKGIILVDESLLESVDGADRKAIRLMLRHHIALVLPLSDQTGYLTLGDRKGGGFGKRDVKLLETISNELVIAIQNSRSVQTVKELNTHLQQRIDAATRELRASNEKLRRLDETKDEFVSMASHQLRTPLTSIKGYISMLLEGDAGKITLHQEKLLTEAFSSSERMVRLISDFLNVSRLQTGKFIIDAHPVDLSKMIGDEIQSMRLMAESHGQKLQYIQPKTAVPEVVIDEDKTRQVVMNFIDNAIYYSAQKTTITIKLRVERSAVVLEVHDQGIGVPKAEQAQLFTKFFRAENARRQRPDGTGVGLFLAKRVIEAQGGEVIFHSRPGMGSVFGFRIPLKK